VSATSVTLRGRAKAESLMQDACTVKRSSSTSDPDTGVVTPTYTTVYSGRCKFQEAAASGSPQDVGQAERMVSQRQLHLPMSVTGPTADDIATCTSSVLDPDLVGKSFTVRAPMGGTFKTARRFPLQELSS
jgi:hypothetical protein